MKTVYKSVLTIAGSDSGGGAGIQADIKSISACGAYAASVITATTAQNTQGIYDIHAIPIAHLEKQLDAVLNDVQFGSVKIGMLHSCNVIEIVASKLKEYNVKNMVLDPVMVATSGDKLINEDAINCLKIFLPQAQLITPNIPEAELLIGHPINNSNFKKTAKEIGEKYNTSVLLKGGHLNKETNVMVDILFVHETNEIHEICNPKINSNNTHGTGCSLSSSIATFLCLGNSLEISVNKACEYVNHAIDNGKNMTLGKGKDPINHFGLK